MDVYAQRMSVGVCSALDGDFSHALDHRQRSDLMSDENFDPLPLGDLLKRWGTSYVSSHSSMVHAYLSSNENQLVQEGLHQVRDASHDIFRLDHINRIWGRRATAGHRGSRPCQARRIFHST